jgi:hypothetical protein
MKCLKNVKTNNIIRVDDVQARQMAGTIWVYISKSEWKVTTRVPETEKQVVESEKKEQTLSKKAEKAAKLKAKQRQ